VGSAEKAQSSDKVRRDGRGDKGLGEGIPKSENRNPKWGVPDGIERLRVA